MQPIWNRDWRLAQRVRQGHTEAGEEIVTLHYEGVCRFLLYLAGNMDIAQELAQDTFVSAWRSMPTYNGKSSLKTWLHRIAYREFSEWRGRQRLTDPLTEHHDCRQDFEEGTITALTAEHAIRSLPSALREAFLLCNLQELSVKEAAEILGVPRGTILSRLHAARVKLRKALAEGDTMSVRPEPDAPCTAESAATSEGMNCYAMSKA